MNELSKFYLIYPINLVEFGLIELKEKWALCFNEEELNILSIDEGGILIEVPKFKGFFLNHLLKTPTRILLRISEFKAKDVPKLYQKIKSIKWNEVIIHRSPKINISSTQSRLFDSRKIEKAIIDGITDSFKGIETKKKFLEILNNIESNNQSENLPKVFCRIFNDDVTISLDTTGEAFHKRNEKIHSAMAPIRETFASMLLIALKAHSNNNSLLDPMCGSGTFLLEAKNYYKLNLNREFAFCYTPYFLTLKDNSIHYKEYRSYFLDLDKTLYKNLSGHDLSDEALSQAKINLKDTDITLLKIDVFKLQKQSMTSTDAIINPPYGIRVGQNSKISAIYYHDIIKNLFDNYDISTIGIIIPDEHRFNSDRWNLLKRIPFKNGGIKVSFYILSK